MSVRTIYDVLQEQAQLRPESSAILSLEHSPLSYGRLYEHIQYTIQALHSFGVGRFQRVGLIAPPGPELATAMLSIASCATVVPLNPNLQAAEYQSYFPLLKLDWIMVPAGTAAEARNAARASAIPVIDMYPAGTEAPLDRLEDIAVRQAQEIRAVQIRGPYFLCGFSYGGRVAMETGRVLRDKYGETAYVLMIDDHIHANKLEIQRDRMGETSVRSG